MDIDTANKLANLQMTICACDREAAAAYKLWTALAEYEASVFAGASPLLARDGNASALCNARNALLNIQRKLSKQSAGCNTSKQQILFSLHAAQRASK